MYADHPRMIFLHKLVRSSLQAVGRLAVVGVFLGVALPQLHQPHAPPDVTALAEQPASQSRPFHRARRGTELPNPPFNPGSDRDRGSKILVPPGKMRFRRPPNRRPDRPEFVSRLPIRPLRQPKNHHRLTGPPGCWAEKTPLRREIDVPGSLNLEQERQNVCSHHQNFATSAPKFSRLAPKFWNLNADFSPIEPI